MKSSLLSLPGQTFPEAFTAEDAGYEDGESDEDGSHGVEKYRLLAEIHVLPPQLGDDQSTDAVQAGVAVKYQKSDSGESLARIVDNFPGCCSFKS